MDEMAAVFCSCEGSLRQAGARSGPARSVLAEFLASDVGQQMTWSMVEFRRAELKQEPLHASFSIRVEVCT